MQSQKLLEDSEWHYVFSCPVGNACRQRFKLALSDCRTISESTENPKEILEIPSKCFRLPTSTDLARLIILCRSESQIASELARFVVVLTGSGKRAFAKLTFRDLFPEPSQHSRCFVFFFLPHLVTFPLGLSLCYVFCIILQS